ncbi:MAG TPA: chorismate mutase [Prolixibacteraceae bacterium]|nr:chorismate mutase [Prolixibacteraceae bacterium]
MAKERKNARDCLSLEEIREEIDWIDRELIRLFALRYEYVKAVVQFKEKTEDAIIAEERKNQVIDERSEWAAQMGLDAEAYALIFRKLIDHNIAKELEILKQTNNH